MSAPDVPGAPRRRPRRGPGNGRRAVLAAIVAAALSSPSGAVAGACPAPPRGRSSDYERAVTLFEVGLDPLAERDYETALDCFMESRALVPSAANTMNAAICLDELERDDEALDLYEEVRRDFAERLDPSERADVERVARELRAKLGGVRITVNVRAAISVDGRPRGALREGTRHVPPGKHRIRVAAAGYLPFERWVRVDAGTLVILDVTLVRPPPEPPTWKPRAGWFLDAYGGFAGGSSMDSDAERESDATCTRGTCPGVSGFIAGLRGGYRSALGVSWEIAGGYLSVSSSFRRVKRDTYEAGGLVTVPYRLELEDNVLLRGTFLGLGASGRAPVSKRFSLMARATAGFVAAKSAHTIDGKAIDERDDSISLDVVQAGRDTVRSSILLYLMPEAGVEAEIGAAHVALLVGAFFSPLDGPSFGRRGLDFAGGCPGPGSSDDLKCAPSSDAAVGGRAYGPFVLFVPQIAAGFTF